VFQYGSESSASLLYFHFSPAKCGFFIVPSRYLFAIGLTAYLVLDVSTTHSHCTPKQHYSFPVLRSGAITRSGHAFHRVDCSAPQRPRAYHWDSSSFGRPYYRNPCLFLFLVLLICLSPDRIPAPASTIRTAPITGRLSHAVAFVIVK